MKKLKRGRPRAEVKLVQVTYNLKPETLATIRKLAISRAAYPSRLARQMLEKATDTE